MSARSIQEPEGYSGQEASFGKGDMEVGDHFQAEEQSLGKEQPGLVEVHTGYQDHRHIPPYS